SATSPLTPLAPATNFQFDFQIDNVGPQTATNVTFTAPIPASLSYGNATPSAGSCLFSAGTVTCNIGSIASGGNAHVVLDLTTTSTAGTHSVTGTASATEGDPIPSNNSVAASAQVTGGTITVVNTNDSGTGSLRQALLDAQSGVCTAPCSIAFNIPSGPFVITPASLLPSIGNNVTVDATTQPGYAGTPIVEVSGNLLFTSPGTLVLSGTNSKLAGLAITNATSTSPGIRISGNLNTVEACYIGVRPSGVAGANPTGIRIEGNNNKIGGNTAAKRNVISANTVAGIRIANTGSANTIIGNYIGTDRTGGSAMPNASGIEISDSSDSNFIGGPTPGEINVISGNTTYGVHIAGLSAGISADNNTITNSYIGTNAAGTASLQNGAAGVAVDDFASATLMTGNIISGNQNGIVLTGAANSGTSILGNLIGIAPDGTTAMGNAQAGVTISGATLARLGTTAPGEGNEIANNGGAAGVVVLGTAIKNTILGNSIHDHTGLGIDLGGDGGTLNDGTDADGGANGLQNTPTLTLASLNGGAITLNYFINSSGTTAGSILTEFYESDGTGEGKTFIARQCVTGNSFSTGLNVVAPGFIAAGDIIVATSTSFTDSACTNAGDGTSEFSNSIVVTTCTPPPAILTAPSSVCSGATNVAASVNAPTATSFNWTISGGTITSGQGTSAITFDPAASGSVLLGVSVTDGASCSNTVNTTIAINAPPVVSISGPSATCAGTPVTLDAGAGYATYAWLPGGQNTRFITVSPTSSTTYSVTVVDGNGCSGSASKTVNVSSNPTATITTSSANACANSTSNTASVAAQSGAVYAWTVSNGTITNGQGTNTITYTAGPSGTINISVSVTVASCVANGATTVTIIPPPAVSITGPTQTCPNTSFTLNAGTGFTSYQWSNGATTQLITVSQSAPTVSYSVIVSNGTCNATATHTVTTITPPSVAISGPASALPNTTGLVASVPNDPLATY
ncbi:MAG TPA: hypothetical protein VJZ00_24765, partial [Thermoanaerobaculia bacterium]|nr:hypothetical protein [Thermoanaerobaculia bacterium]